MNFGCAKVSNFASSAMEINSIQMQHMDIRYDSESSSESDDTVYGTSPPTHCSVSSLPTIAGSRLEDQYDSSYEADDVPIGLSPPTASLLLQRRSEERRKDHQKRGLVNVLIPQMAH